MKKTILVLLVIFSLAALAGCSPLSPVGETPQALDPAAPGESVAQEAALVPAEAPPTEPAEATATDIGEAKAKEIALGHAEKTETEVAYVRAKLDYDDGRSVYDIEFFADDTEYDYEIDAHTGEILSYDFDIETYTASQASTTAPNLANGTDIGEAKAKEIALGHAKKTEAEVTYVRAKRDYDDGRTVYDIEFYVSNAEYDYEVDAYTGDVLSYDYDIEHLNAASGTVGNDNSAYIGLDAAKEIALKKAKLSAGDVRYTEASFEHDDGVAVYQIEFVADNMEYEFEIDATTGAIREYDVDRRD